jgi:radical SAM-linked protein
VFIDPLGFPGELLLTVEKPARYTGGEHGSLARGKPADASLLTMLIAFPDLYEIGMSNQAFRIIYNALNAIEGVSCDRAFAPAPDFEGLLRSHNTPLYGLDTGISFNSLDVLMFTLGYELGITEVLAMLDLGFVPLTRAERGEGDPIVIMGGPCVSNPLPYARFIDAFWIGEAEAGFFDLAAELRDLKNAGAPRAALLERLCAHPSVWTEGKPRAVRAVDAAFASRPPSAAVFPVAAIKTAQQHGAVEIMRGCPNGCRFCHAGVWYRPMRQKSAGAVREEVAAFVNDGGYREISLSSLSTGDYRHIDSLVGSLNDEYASRHISFQLPSLRVSTFSLSLLEKVSMVRKSPLTFAVETPADAWQMSINKAVSRDTVSSILAEAKRNGWRGAKFYFMVGLPPAGQGRAGEKSEEEEIVEFILEVASRAGMHFNINVGAFVPKPHTPYQWAAQIDEETAREKIRHIRSSLKQRGHKVNYNDPFIALIEGILSRGDERVGELIEEAYRRGCRFDAWDEHIKKDIWEDLLKRHGPLVQELIGERDAEKPLPWDCIDSGVSAAFLKGEYDKSKLAQFTLPCGDACDHPCGNCGGDTKIISNIIHDDKLLQVKRADQALKRQDTQTLRILFSFTKQGAAVFLPHLALIELFSMAFIRAGIPILFTQGFNPIPKLNFASPLSLGVQAGGEIASIDLEPRGGADFTAGDFMLTMNRSLPDGMRVEGAVKALIPPGDKKRSIPSLLWGAVYEAEDGGDDLVPALEEKSYRVSRTSAGRSLLQLRRKTVLAKSPGDPQTPASYFAVYRSLYPSS